MSWRTLAIGPMTTLLHVHATSHSKRPSYLYLILISLITLLCVIPQCNSVHLRHFQDGRDVITSNNDVTISDEHDVIKSENYVIDISDVTHNRDQHVREHIHRNNRLNDVTDVERHVHRNRQTDSRHAHKNTQTHSDSDNDQINIAQSYLSESDDVITLPFSERQSEDRRREEQRERQTGDGFAVRLMDYSHMHIPRDDQVSFLLN